MGPQKETEFSIMLVLDSFSERYAEILTKKEFEKLRRSSVSYDYHWG